MNAQQAIEIIARHALAARSESVADDRENYPDVGEADWEAIVQEANWLRVYPSTSEYEIAYAVLSARADD